MKWIPFEYSRKEAYPLAVKHYLRMCGEEAESLKGMEEAAVIHERLQPFAGLRGCIAMEEAPFLMGDRIEINDVPIACRYFETLSSSDLAACAAYVLSAGEDVCVEERTSDMLFRDLWRTAYIEAGRELIKAAVCNESPKEWFVSESFGPGNLGMEMNQLEYFLRIFEDVDTGVLLSEYGTLFPPKSCAEMFLFLKNSDVLPVLSCMGCLGTSEGCRFCRRKQSL